MLPRGPSRPSPWQASSSSRNLNRGSHRKAWHLLPFHENHLSMMGSLLGMCCLTEKPEQSRQRCVETLQPHTDSFMGWICFRGYPLVGKGSGGQQMSPIFHFFELVNYCIKNILSIAMLWKCIFKLRFFLKKKVLFMGMGVLPTCTTWISGAHRSHKRALDPLNWSYRWLWVAVWVLRIKPRAFVRARAIFTDSHMANSEFIFL